MAEQAKGVEAVGQRCEGWVEEVQEAGMRAAEDAQARGDYASTVDCREEATEESVAEGGVAGVEGCIPAFMLL